MSKTSTQIRRHILDLAVRSVPVEADTPKSVPSIVALMKRYSTLVALDDAAPFVVDGYASKTAGARPSTPSFVGEVHEDDIGIDTPVEAAVLRLLGKRDIPDAIHFRRVEADTAASKIADGLVELGAVLDRVDELRMIAPVDAEYCYVAKVVCKLPFDDVWAVFRRTTFKNYLSPAWPEERPVSRWVYRFVQDNRRLPTPAEMRQRLQREAVQLDALATARAAAQQAGRVPA